MAQPQGPPIDMSGYVQHVRSRTTALEKRALALRKRQRTGTKQIELFHTSLKGEIAQVSGDLDELNGEIHDLAMTMKKLVAKIQQIAMKEQLMRLNDKADGWHPENYITRNEFKRIAKEK